VAVEPRSQGAPASVGRPPAADRVASRGARRDGVEPSPVDALVARRLGEPVTRRQFVVRAAVFGVSAAALGAILEACAQITRPTGSPGATASPSPVVTPGPTFRGTPPVIDPPPTTATYGAMLETSALAPVDLPSAGLRALLDEAAADAGLPVAAAIVDGRRQARLTVTADDPSFASQAYRLEVAPTTDGPAVTVRAGDEAGAFNGLLSLARLVAVEGPTRWLRAAVVEDAPAFARRGAILDPYVLPDIGMTDASRALLLERVRLGVRFKLNFLDLVDRTPWPEIVHFCDDHHVELMNGIGYQDRLVAWWPAEDRRRLDEVLDAGTRSIALCFDDVPTTNPEALAGRHASVFRDLYTYLRARDPAIQVSTVLPPYGGIPGRNLVFSEPGDGERYLAVMREAIPADVRVFWTGDGGIFSQTVTTAGAKAYADAVGHELGLWDNDTIRFSREGRPCSGRAPDLSSVVHAYMGNLAGEASWEGTSGELALLTSLFYTWNPATYDPAAAAAAAERILASG
jgi:beta-N-acetylglucosaminidase